MKVIKTILLSLLLVASTGAIANSMPPTKTYEAMIKSVRLPKVPDGTLADGSTSPVCHASSRSVTHATVVEGSPGMRQPSLTHGTREPQATGLINPLRRFVAALLTTPRRR